MRTGRKKKLQNLINSNSARQQDQSARELINET